VIALGKIGLPLAVQFASHGWQVIAVDIDPAVVTSINAGRSHVTEEPELAAAGLSIRLAPALAALRVERLDRIDRALQAMRDPSYGTCALCGREIEVERLAAALETRLCGGCAGEAVQPRA